MKQVKAQRIDIPIYRRKVIAYKDISYDNMQKAIEDEFGVYVDGIKKGEHTGAVWTLINEKKGINCLVFWSEYSKDIENFSHEVFHLTATVLQDAGVKLTEESEEAWAYLYGYLFKQLSF